MSHWDFGQSQTGQDGPPRPEDERWNGDPHLAGAPRAAGGRALADDPWPADGYWREDGQEPASERWPASERRPASERWSPGRSGPADGGRRADDDGEDDPGPYPITYERDPVNAPPLPWRTPAAEPDPGGQAWPPAAYPGPAGDPDPAADVPDAAPADPGGLGVPGRDAPGQPAGPDPGDWADWETGRARRGRGGRRLLLAGVAVAGAALGAAAVLLTAGRPAAGGSAAPSAAPQASAGASASAGAPGAPPLTLAQARQVLAAYTTANNAANVSRSDALLATVETGSSYAIDAALYQAQRATAAAAVPPFSPVGATYYIPRGEPATGPRWFAVQVASAFSSSPGKTAFTDYMLFTQSAPGQPWRDAIECYLLSSTGLPQVAVGADGLVTAVSPQDGADAVAPGQLPAAAVAALNGAGSGSAGIAAPGNLADSTDAQQARKDAPGGQVQDVHALAPGADGQEFALLTMGGGALVFFTDAAALTVTPPPGSLLRMTVPGLYSASQGVSRAGLSYLEQFTVYDPPAGGGAPRVVADYSGITGKN